MAAEGLRVWVPRGPPLGELTRGAHGWTVKPPPPSPPQPTCSPVELARLQEEYLADDLPLDLPLMTRWTERQARAFFESGGSVIPVLPSACMSLASLLDEAALASFEALLSRDSMETWCMRFHHAARACMLHRLRRLGVHALADRQAICNAFQRAWREGRLAGPTPQLTPLDTPAQLLEQAAAHVSHLRSLPAEEQRLKLGELHLQEDAALINSSRSSVEVIRDLNEVRLGDAMEELGMSFDAVQLLLSSRGMAASVPERKVAFWTNQMGERGTEVAIFDYADFGERLLGLSSYVLYPFPPRYTAMAHRFARRFGKRCIGVENFEQALDLCQANGISLLYILKEGGPHVPTLPKRCPVATAVHAIFDARVPSGDAYARISPTVPDNGRGCPVVPHIVRPRNSIGGDLRRVLRIPSNATVFGRYGGLDTFSIDFVHAVVIEVALANPTTIYFLFMNTLQFCDPLPNVIHLEATSDEEEKSRFIRTCDAMLHARYSGETFGLAVAEFSAHNRPVFTSNVHDDGGAARNHINVLGNKAILYHDRTSLLHQLYAFDREDARLKDWNEYREYEPAKVMRIFARVFLRIGSGGHVASADK